jgi:hypothetical protein
MPLELRAGSALDEITRGKHIEVLFEQVFQSDEISLDSLARISHLLRFEGWTGENYICKIIWAEARQHLSKCFAGNGLHCEGWVSE